MTYSGQVAKVLSVFAVVFVLIIILHLIMLSIQYSTAGTLVKTQSVCSFENDGYLLI